LTAGRALGEGIFADGQHGDQGADDQEQAFGSQHFGDLNGDESPGQRN
jgi:hypothetical protein